MSSNIKPCRTAAEPSKPQKAKYEALLGKLTRNVAIAAALLLTVVGIRDTAAHGGDFVQALKNAVEREWDQNVGRLTYVSTTLAESIQVFGRKEPELLSPVARAVPSSAGGDASYLMYSAPGTVYAAAEGEVTQIAHDDNGRSIVRVYHANGMDTIYYGLDACAVQEGDPVDANTVLGHSAGAFAFEAQKYGRPIEVSALLRERTEGQ